MGQNPDRLFYAAAASGISREEHQQGTCAYHCPQDRLAVIAGLCLSRYHLCSGDREFRVPNDYKTHSPSLRYDDEGNKYIRVPGVHWFTNLEHGRRHEPLKLMTEAENIKYSKHKEVRGIGYYHYHPDRSDDH